MTIYMCYFLLYSLFSENICKSQAIYFPSNLFSNPSLRIWQNYSGKPYFKCFHEMVLHQSFDEDVCKRKENLSIVKNVLKNVKEVVKIHFDIDFSNVFISILSEIEKRKFPYTM